MKKQIPYEQIKELLKVPIIKEIVKLRKLETKEMFRVFPGGDKEDKGYTIRPKNNQKEQFKSEYYKVLNDIENKNSVKKLCVKSDIQQSCADKYRYFDRTIEPFIKRRKEKVMNETIKWYAFEYGVLISSSTVYSNLKKYPK
jgi:hypothetical protein